MEDKVSLRVEETISIDVYQSGGLVRHTRRLADATARSTDENERVCFATATLLMGAAALEGAATEVAFRLQPSLFSEKKFRFAGMPEKLERLAGRSFPEAEKLQRHRNALTHAEPGHDRSRDVGGVLNVEGAKWVADLVEEIFLDLCGDRMPEKLIEAADIPPKAR
jgi:hypothetical protein